MDAETTAELLEYLPPLARWTPLLYGVAVFVLLGAALEALGRAVAWQVGGLGRVDANAVHWSELARRLVPARAATLLRSVLLWAVAWVSAFWCAGPLCAVPAGVLFLAWALAAELGALPVHARAERRWLPRWTPRVALASSAAVMLVFRSSVLVPCALAFHVPADPGPAAFAAWAGALLLLLVLASGGSVFVARAVGLAWPAPERLARAVERAAKSRGLPPRAPLVLAWGACNALAFPWLGRIAFTPRALELFDDRELEAIAAHELGHLAEPLGTRLARAAAVPYLALVLLWPPIVAAWGTSGLLVGLILALVLVRWARRRSRALETAADHAAHGGDDDPVYGRALERLYRDNLVPAVQHGEGGTHPHLYDRMVAAGVEPDFPRPERPVRARVPGLVLVLAAVAVLLAVGHVAGAFGEPASDARARLAVQLASGRARPYVSAGNLAWEVGDHGAAAAFWGGAAALWPEAPDPVYARVDALLQLRRYGSAEAALAEARARAREAGVADVWAEVDAELAALVEAGGARQ